MKVSEYIEHIDRDDISIHVPLEEVLECELNNGILLISHEFTKTGAPLQLLELSIVLMKLGYRTFVYSFEYGDIIQDFLNNGAVVIYGKPSEERLEDWLTGMVSGFEIVFVNTLLLAPIIRLLAPVVPKLFWWIHENSYWYKYEYCINLPDIPSVYILASSSKSGNYIRKYMNRESQILNVCCRDFGLSAHDTDHKPVFLWAGSMDFNKAPEIFLGAIVDLEKSHKNNAEFLLFGDNGQKNEYTELVENVATFFSNIHYLPVIPHNELMEVMDEVDAVVVSSADETTSMVAVEGMMKGKTVICSDGCGVSEYLNDNENALIFPSNSIEALKEKMEYVIENRKMSKEIGEKGRRIYEKYYSDQIMEETVIKLFDRIGKINNNMKLCSGCGACSLICPVNAISMKEIIGGFRYPEIDPKKCINCKKCKEVCAVNKNTVVSDPDYEEIFAYRMNDPQKRMKSQSGGAFSALAEAVLSEDGIVYGVMLNEEFEAEYIEIDKIEDLYKIQGSKYVQANTKSTFNSVKNRLKEGKRVLFGGTSCHVDALLGYLKGMDISNLFTCDLVCHGVPAPELFKKYIKYQRSLNGEIKNYNFRDKSAGGWHFSIETWHDPDDILHCSRDYTDLFYSDMALRESCYNCKYSSFDKPADITVGDFWGIENVMPEMDDNMGVSLVIVRNEKGKTLFANMQKDAVILKVPREKCIQQNLIAPTPRPASVYALWDEYRERPYRYILQSFTGNGFNRLFDSKIINILKSDNGIDRKISSYLSDNNISITGICGNYACVKLFMIIMKGYFEKTPVIIDVFGDKRRLLGTDTITLDEFKENCCDGTVLVADEMHCEVYMSELKKNGIKTEKIIPISFMLDEEV